MPLPTGISLVAASALAPVELLAPPAAALPAVVLPAAAGVVGALPAA
jgi:hypothetical protein